jgi:lysophospholipase L1-like esterase
VAMRLAAIAALVAVLGVAGSAGSGGGSGGARHEYVALGDSLAASVQPDAKGSDHATSSGYAEKVWQARMARIPGLRLVKLGRGGETAASMIASSKAGKSQLEQAEDELHTGKVDLVTIDIGANEVERCRVGDGFDAGCVEKGLSSLRISLPTILQRLRVAGGAAVQIVGINYYNSFLGQWVTGPAGRRLAHASERVERRINRALSAVYASAGIKVVDVETLFEVREMSRYIHTAQNGRVPVAVARTCRWTWACSDRYDDHTNTAGYRVIALGVLAVLRSS